MSLRRIKFFNAIDWVQDVELEGRVYTLRAKYNVRQDTWHMDIDTVDGVAILRGLRLVVNWPLLYPFRYKSELPPGELFVLRVGEDATTDPMRDSFQTGLALYYDSTV